MPERTLTIRIAVEGAEAARREAVRLADAFESAAERLGAGSEVAVEHERSIAKLREGHERLWDGARKSSDRFSQGAKQQADQFLQPWKKAFSSLDDAIVQTILKGDRGLEKFRQIGLRLAVDIGMAYARATLLPQIGSTLGLSNLFNALGAGGRTGSAAGGRRNAGIPSSPFGAIGGGRGFFDYLNTLSFGGLFSVDPVATTASGFGAGAHDSFAEIGSGQGLLPVKFGEVLGGAGLGFSVGSFIGALQPFGKQGPGGSIGGTLGGIGGTFLTPWLGPFGPIAGSVLGGLLGSLFGPKKSVGPGVVGLSTFERGSFDFAGIETDNKGDPAQARKLGEDLTKALDAFKRTTDATIREGFQFAIGFNPTEKFTFNLRRRAEDGSYPIGLRTDVKHFETFDEAFIGGIRKSIEEGDFSGLGDDVAKAINNSLAKTAEAFGKDIDFGVNFRDALKQMNDGLDPAKSQLTAIAKAAEQFGDGALDFVTEFQKKAAELKLATPNEVDPALRSMLKGMLGLVDLGEPLEGIALKLAQTQANFEALKPALEQAGFSAAEAGDLIAQGFAKFKTELGDDFLEALGRSANEAMGKGFLNRIEDVGKQADALFADALRLFDPGDPRLAEAVGGINDVFGGLVEQTLRGLDAGQLQQVIDAYAEIDTAQGQFIRQMAENTLAWREATDALSEAGRKLVEELDVRELALAGDDRGALIRKGEIDKARQIAAASAEGLDADQLARLAEVIDGELNKALDEFDRRASAAAAAAAKAAREFDDDLTVRELRLAGDEQGAAIEQLEQRQQAEIDAAIAAGRTTEEIERLSDVLEGEFQQALDAIEHATTDTLRRGGLAIQRAIDPDFRPEALDVLLNAGISEDAAAGLGALSTAIDGLNANIESADALIAAGEALDDALEAGAITTDEYNAVLGYLTSTYQRAGESAGDAAEEISALDQALAGLRATIAGGFTSGAAVAQLSVSEILGQVAPGVAAALTAPFQGFLDAAGRGSGYLQLAGELGATIEGLAGSLTPEQVQSLDDLVRTIINIGDARFADIQRQIEEQTPRPPREDPEAIAREAEERARRAADINADVMARLLESQGRALEAQLARFDVAADAQRQEAQDVGADLARLNQVLDAERQAIIDGFAKQAAQFNDDLQVRLLRAQGKELDAQLLAFDQAAEDQRAEAARLGGDLALLNQVLGLERHKIIDGFEDIGDALEETLKRAIDQFRGYVEGLAFGATSPLTPEQRLAEAQAAFGATITRAREKDAAAIEALPKVAEQLLEEARGFYASGAAYTTLFELTRSQLQQVLGVIGSPTTLPHFAGGGMAAPGWALVGEGGAELVRFGRAAQVFPAAVSRRLEAAAGNDNGAAMDALGAKLDAIAERLDALLRVTAAGGELSIDELRAMREGLGQLARKVNQKDAA